MKGRHERSCEVKSPSENEPINGTNHGKSNQSKEKPQIWKYSIENMTLQTKPLETKSRKPHATAMAPRITSHPKQEDKINDPLCMTRKQSQNYTHVILIIRAASCRSGVPAEGPLETKPSSMPIKAYQICRSCCPTERYKGAHAIPP